MSGERVGLVLGAGGAVGEAFHAGVLAGLADSGWDARDAEIIVGTSTGAVTGTLLRGGMSSHDLYARITSGEISADGRALVARAGPWPQIPAVRGEHRVRADRRLWASLARAPWRIRPGVIVAGAAPIGGTPPDAISHATDRLLDGRWPEQCLRVCATDLDTGERVVFDGTATPDVPPGRAIAASCAIPGCFDPVTIDGRRCIDGGTHSPVNADVLADALPALDALVVSIPMGAAGSPGRLGADLPGRWLNHFFGRWETRAARRARVELAVIEPTASELELMHYNAFDTARVGEIAARARQRVASFPNTAWAAA